MSTSRAQPTQTLFLPECPADLTESTIERHFRGFVGFDSCRVRFDRSGKVVGFVEFERVDDAVRARESMQTKSPFSGEPWNISFSTNPNRTPAPKRGRDDGGQQRHQAVRGAPQAPPHAAQRAPYAPPPPHGYLAAPPQPTPPPGPPTYARVPGPPSLEPPPQLLYHHVSPAAAPPTSRVPRATAPAAAPRCAIAVT